MSHSDPGGLSGVAAAVRPAVIVLAVLGGVSPESTASTAAPTASTSQGVELLIEAVGDRRPVEGRLSGGFGYGEFPPPDGDSGKVDLEALEALALASRTLETDAKIHRTPEALHGLGLLRIVQRRHGEAVVILRDASLRAPADAAILSDLAAAYLARANAGDPFDLVLALDAAARAARLDPGLPEALFNRALVLERLSLRFAATNAWESYLEEDPSSGWAREAGERAKGLEAATLRQQWDAEHGAADEAAASGDLKTARELARRFPGFARSHVEQELLPTWGQRIEGKKPEEARRILEVARSWSRALAEVSGEHLAGDSVAVLDAAVGEGDPARLELLAGGHRLFGEGLELYRRQDCTGAVEKLKASREALAEAGSPFERWPAFFVAVCTHFAEAHQALDWLRSARKAAAADDLYPAYLGRLDWMIGLSLAAEGRLAAALEPFEEAHALFERAGDITAQASIAVNLAGVHERLGEPAKAWPRRLEAIEGAARSGELRGLHNALFDAVQALLMQDRPDLALMFQSELVANARRWGSRTATAEALLQRAAIYDGLGEPEQAHDDLAQARAVAAELAPGTLRERLQTDLRAEEAVTALLSGDPRQAVELSGAVIEELDATGHRERLPRLLERQAEAHLALGDTESAEKDLERALDLLEQRSTDPADESTKVHSFETAQRTFDAMIRLQAEVRRDPAKAFAAAERSRARVLMGQLRTVEGSPGSRGVEDPRPLRAEEVIAALPAGVALVEYAVLPERLLVWVLRREGIETIEQPVEAEDLAREVTRLQHLLERDGSVEEIREVAGGLFLQLVAPALPSLRGAHHLILVPDRFLFQLPFAVLYDASRRRYLVEDFTLAVAPSATLALAARERSRAFTGSEARSLLAIGNPALDRAAFPEFPELPAAEAAASEIAGLYGRSEVLVGPAATAGRVLTALGRYRVVHLAAHAESQPLAPLRSRILLAPSRQEPDHGALTLDQLAPRDLSGTEVVVLSMCRSAELFPDAAREGVAGLARGFLASGVPAVLATLWSVDDRSISELSLPLHRALAAGAPPAEALRTAQLSLLRGPRAELRHPAVWGALALFGSAGPKE